MAKRPDSSQHSFGWEAYFNRGLFANHFLEHRLRDLPEWREADGLEEAFKALQKRYHQHAARFSKKTNEAQTEHDFVQPVLDILWRDKEPGDCYQVQVRIPNIDANRQPDYAFFREAADHEAAAPKVGTMDFWQDVPCLGDAKKWSASLDRDPLAHENPTAQVCNYLYRSRVRWGILTNGRIWRLYEREKSSAGGIYYEANLEEILKQASPDPFKYFYLFFRRCAFLPDATGATFLDKVFRGSVEYATEVGDRLKDSVYDALRLLMHGFVEHAANALDRKDPATLALVHENSLIVLYRLLFLLYAEDRDLLPRKTEPYASYSLYRLQREINQHLRERKTFLAAGRRFWGELTNLCELIDGGFEEGGIPAYNGGLFSALRYPHLAHTAQPEKKRWEIGDRFLAEAIDRLAYERKRWNEPGENDVDYATLEVQHLGSIYEGLLELQPHVAEEPLVRGLGGRQARLQAVRETPNRRPVRGQTPRTVNTGEVYLISDRGERKATGSYYTPKFIVDYIVQNTVGPLAEAAAHAVARLRPKADERIAHLERKRQQFVKKGKQGNLGPVTRDLECIERQIDDEKQHLLEPYLSLRVLDPAMGSGHFLVGVADFLSMAMATDPSLLPAAAAADDPQAFYKRRVVERCLYGVDLNPLAVELAKLSLWLHTVSKDKALSFLDHHLRCGNSLIGARIQENLVNEPPCLDSTGRWLNRDISHPTFAFTRIFKLAHIQSFLDTFRKIAELTGGDVATQHNKDGWYRLMDAHRDKFRTVANCWLAPFFGVRVSAEQYEHGVTTLHDPTAWETLHEEMWLQRAQATARKKSFFHWELEFPEAFFDATGLLPDGEAGFDAVLGNPPYVRVQELLHEDTDYFKTVFTVAHRRIDISILFYERAIALLRNGAVRVGLITTTQFFATEYGKELREMLSRLRIVRIDDLRDLPVFPEAITYSGVFIIQKAPPAPFPYRQFDGLDVRDLPTALVGSGGTTIVTQPGSLSNSTWEFAGTQEANVKARLETGPVIKLQEIADTAYGVLTGCDAVFVGDAESFAGLEKDLLVKIILPRDTDRWLLRSPDATLLYPYLDTENGTVLMPYGTMSKQFPKAAKYLSLHQSKLETRRDSRELFASRGDWHGLVRYSSWEVIKSKKIVTQGIVRHNEFCLDDLGCAFIGKGVSAIIPTTADIYYLLGVLNSSVAAFYLRRICPIKQGGYLTYAISYLNQVPVRKISMVSPTGLRNVELEKAKQMYRRYLSDGDVGAVLERAELHLRQTPEQADIVHDLVAFLAEELVVASKRMLAESTGFLTWLVRKLGVAVDDLTNKTKVREYDRHEFGVLLGVLCQNRRRLSIDPESRAVQESLEREYSKSMEKLAPLKAKIAATDRLIDLIVYRLYGLTKKEIAIVEGN